MFLLTNLDRNDIKYTMLDNAFDYISDFEKAQEICDNIDVKKIHKHIDTLLKNIVR